jgi:hypothetical protein
MRRASISIGIVDYAARHYRDSTMQLHYAVSDAIDFHRYLQQGVAEPDEQARHILITDRSATAAGLASAFTQLAADSIDVLIVYMSGHGERGDKDGGWFCLVDAVPGERSLGGAELDALLHKINAEQVLVLVDCCHAEAVFRGARYFAELGTAQTRLLIASARANQQAWEDAGLRRSVFSEVLLRGCSSELHLQNSVGMIDVERTLLPYLREQVVFLTAANKGGRVQEPVTGGLSALPLMLHSVSGKAFGRSLSLADTLRMRLRQILTGIVSIAVILVVLIHLVSYHLAANSGGGIMVQTGLVLTNALLPPWLQNQIDTGYFIADLDAGNTDFVSALARGQVRGIGSHRDDLGLNAWSSHLAAKLAPPLRARYSVLVRGEAVQFDENVSAAPVEEAQFLLSKDGAMPLRRLKLIYPVDQPHPQPCASDPGKYFDFVELNPSPKVSGQETIWWALSAGRHGGDALGTFDDLITRAAYRSFHEKNSVNRRYEAAVLALALVKLASDAPAGVRSGMQQHAMAMLATHCRWHAALALGLVAPAGDDAAAAQAEAVLAQEISQFGKDGRGAVSTGRQELAADALLLLARQRPLNMLTLGVIAEMVRNDTEVVGGGSFPQHLLLALAERQALPESILQHIVARLSQLPKNDASYEQLGIARVLSRNFRYLPEQSKLALKLLLKRLEDLHSTAPEYFEALGFAGPLGEDDSRSAVILYARLSPSVLFATPSATFRGDTLIALDEDAAAIGLGRLGQTVKLNQAMQEWLDRLAMARPDLPSRTALVTGLAYQRYSDAQDMADSIYRNLANAGASARRRLLEVELACTAVLGRSRQTRNLVRQQLLAKWDDETAPEIRHGLALTIARIQFPILGELNLCRGIADVVVE